MARNLMSDEEWALFALFLAAVRKLDGASRLPEIIDGVEFKGGIKQEKHAA